MSLSFIAVTVTILSFAILCGPPALALRMLLARLRWARPQSRTIYLMLCAATGLLLGFTTLVAFGAIDVLTALTPSVVAENLGTTALLFAWTSAGLCLLLAVIAPLHHRATHF